MDRISGLTDELLITILSFLRTKDAVTTCVLSKRWEFLWMWLPKLEYVARRNSTVTWGSKPEYEDEGLQYFLDRAMPLHRAPVIEKFRLELCYLHWAPESIRMWLVSAVFRHLRELDISFHDYPSMQNILPSSLYACKSLVTLKLCGDILADVPRIVCLPSLKTLQLKKVSGFHGESLRRILLSARSVLENLLVDFCEKDGIGKITVIVPSLLSLSLKIPYEGDLDGVEIGTPSLKYLNLEDLKIERHPFSIENMPELEEAFVDVSFLDIKSLISSITSVKRLTLCSEVVYGSGFVFNQLKHLKLCDCRSCSSKLLARLLQDSPNLRMLDILKMADHKTTNMDYWTQPRNVPECFLSSLETFKWLKYLGRMQERVVVVYILKNAHRLKTATISPDERFTPKFEMLRDLSRSSRASTTCELIFY